MARNRYRYVRIKAARVRRRGKEPHYDSALYRVIAAGLVLYLLVAGVICWYS